jgi:hypothetical protein
VFPKQQMQVHTLPAQPPLGADFSSEGCEYFLRSCCFGRGNGIKDGCDIFVWYIAFTKTTTKTQMVVVGINIMYHISSLMKMQNPKLHPRLHLNSLKKNSKTPRFVSHPIMHRHLPFITFRKQHKPQQQKQPTR